MKFIGMILPIVAAAMLAAFASSASAQCCRQNVIRAQLVDLPNDKGRVACIIFNAPDGFPRDRSKGVQQVRGPIQNESGTCTFSNLPPGTYAIAAFHDEYETGKMKTNFLGVPQEAFGFSNDAKPSALTPPPFSAAAFSYQGGVISITMHAQR